MDYIALGLKALAFLSVFYLCCRIFSTYITHVFAHGEVAVGFAPPQSAFPRYRHMPLFIKVISLALCLRLLTYIVTYIAYSILQNEPTSFLESFRSVWYHWDTDSFMIISKNWYIAEGPDKYRLAFYPLYPLVIKLTQLIVGSYFLAGIIISLTSYCLASWVLFKLMIDEFHDEQLAWTAVKFMGIYPFSYYFGIVYTESLFLLLSISCFYFMRKEMWLYAGIAGGLAAFTRNQGLLLIAPFILEACLRYPIYDKLTKQWTWNRQFSIALLFSSLVAMGFVGYLLINKQVTGDYFRFIDYQKENWSNHFSFFANNIGEIYLRALNDNFRMRIGIWLPTTITFFGVVGLITYTIRRIPPSYSLYAVILLVISFSPSWLLSAPRYTAIIFPIFMSMAFIVKNRTNWDQVLTICCASLLICYAFLFTQGHVY